MKRQLKKIKRLVAKYDELFFIIIFFIIIFGKAVYIESIPEDEVWNFQNIYKMYNGYKIYIDANVITTPVFHFIGLILFKILGANFFVFRLYNVFINLFLFLGLYKILKTLNNNKMLSFFFTIIIFIINGKVIYSTANYNGLTITFVIYALFVLLNREKYKYYNLYEAVFMTLIILTKQNIGIFYLIGYLFYAILRKDRLKDILKILLIESIFLFIFIIILFRLEILEGFINYCILGLGEFSEKNFATSVGWTLYMILISLINALIIVFIKFNCNIGINKNEKNNIYIIACFAYPILLIAYPLFNSAHINYALILQHLLFLYMLYVIMINKNIGQKISVKYLVSILIIVFGLQSVDYTQLYFSKIFNDKYKYNDVYFGTLFNKENENKIEEVTKYIKDSQKEVIILSPDSAIYMIHLNRNNAELDLILFGNLGKGGEDSVIDKVSKLRDKIILMNKNKVSYQESDKLREYVENNFKNIGEMHDLLIYETK